jgi:Xaa-Pro aminopeptidase
MKRIKKVQKSLSSYGVDALIVQNPIDLFYLLGVELSAGTLLITKEQARLFVDGRYIEKCKLLAPVEAVLSSNEAIIQFVSDNKKVTSIGFDANTTTYVSFVSLAYLQKNLVPLAYPIEKIRMVKEASEIKAIEKSAKLCLKGFDFVCSLIRTGVTEKELARSLEIFWLQHGGEKLAFDPIIAFGKNSSMPHYRAQDVKLCPHDIVLIDIGVMLNGYASDITRVLFYGKPDPKLLKIYDIVEAAKDKAFEACKPGVLPIKLYEVASKVIEKAGYKEAFLHGLGHGFGLQVHEVPYLKTGSPSSLEPLEAGTVVTLEPGIYLSGLGGVRLEDMVLITKDGARALTQTAKEKLIIPVRS